MKGIRIAGVPTSPHGHVYDPVHCYTKGQSGHMPLTGVPGSNDMNGRPCFVPMPLEIVIAFDFDIVIEMN